MNLPTGTTCYLGMGGNLGQPMQLFDQVLIALQANPQCHDVRESSRFESEPIDATGPNYINSVIELKWFGTAEALLHTCMALEEGHGRLRSTINAPRLIDLDVLLFGQERIETDLLTVPHPRMLQRRFVLEPLLELNPQVSLPELGLASHFLHSTLEQRLHRVCIHIEPDPDTHV